MFTSIEYHQLSFSYNLSYIKNHDFSIKNRASETFHVFLCILYKCLTLYPISMVIYSQVLKFRYHRSSNAYSSKSNTCLITCIISVVRSTMVSMIDLIFQIHDLHGNIFHPVNVLIWSPRHIRQRRICFRCQAMQK